MSANERSGWRDANLSLRHREWGFNCPAVDVDFLMCEFDNLMPVALIDYKCKLPSQRDKRDESSLSALCKLANMANLPCYIVYYQYVQSTEEWSFWVYTKNTLGEKLAKECLCDDVRKPITEEYFVTFLYFLRGREFGIGRNVADVPLSNSLPDMCVLDASQ